jgi:probable selenium-dependent hydroxylase accessory protein YqeC
MDDRAPPVLATALALGSACVVAFTGGGGKTSAMYRLARECSGRVVVTTTTRIWLPRAEQAELRLATTLDDALGIVRDPTWAAGVRAIGTSRIAEGKLQGIPPEWVDALAGAADVLLVEADGAAGKPLTAPRAYEPVIPTSADLVVPVAGADAIGAPLTPEHVHRAVEMADLLGAESGTCLSPALIAHLLLGPGGNVKGAPAGARIVPLINKVDDAARLAAGRELAQELFRAGAERVVLARLASDPPCVEALDPAIQRAG